MYMDPFLRGCSSTRCSGIAHIYEILSFTIVITRAVIATEYLATSTFCLLHKLNDHPVVEFVSEFLTSFFE